MTTKTQKLIRFGSIFVLCFLGGLIVSCAPAWVSEGRYVVAPYGRFLRVYTVPRSFNETDERLPLRTRTLGGHEGCITAVIAIAPTRVASASLDGTVRVWDVEEGTLLSTKDLGVEIRGLVQKGTQEQVYALGKKGLWDVPLSAREGPRNLVRWKDGSFVGRDAGSQVLVVAKKKVFCIFDVTDKGLNTKRKLTVRHEDRITSLAVNSRNGMIAVGDKKGRITVYFDLIPGVGESLQWPPRNAKQEGGNKEAFGLSQRDVEHSTIHWHSSSVVSLTFTRSGSHLMSGGAEATLVLWSMQKTNFGTRVFRPRLGGAIIGIADSPASSMVALCTADNALRLINASSRTVIAEGLSMSIPLRFINENDVLQKPKKSLTSINTVSKSFYAKRGLGCAEHGENSKPLNSVACVTFVPDRSAPGVVLVAGLNTDVQLYDVFSQTHISHFPIVHRNVVHIGAYVQDAYIPIPPVISCVASTSSHPHSDRRNTLLATIDFQMYRVGSGVGPQPYGHLETLRIFQSAERDVPQLEQSSLIRAPHGHNGRTSSMIFHPLRDILVTTSTFPRGEFVVWAPVDNASEVTQPGDKRQWKACNTYNHRHQLCHSAAWSPDGTVLAVATGHTVTLWRMALDDEVEDLKLFRVFTNRLPTEHIYALSFAGLAGSEMLITATDSGVSVWDLLSGSVTWSICVPVKAGVGLATDSHGRRFAIVAEIKSETFADAKSVHNVVVLFSTNSPVPLGAYKVVAGREIVSLAFVASRDLSENSRGQKKPDILVYMDNEMEMFAVGNDLKSIIRREETKDGFEDTAANDGGIESLTGSNSKVLRVADSELSRNTNENLALEGEAGAVLKDLGQMFPSQTHTIANISSLVKDYATSVAAKVAPVDEDEDTNIGKADSRDLRRVAASGGRMEETSVPPKTEATPVTKPLTNSRERIQRFQSFFNLLESER